MDKVYGNVVRAFRLDNYSPTFERFPSQMVTPLAGVVAVQGVPWVKCSGRITARIGH